MIQSATNFCRVTLDHVQQHSKLKKASAYLNGNFFTNRVKNYIFSSDSVPGKMIHAFSNRTAEMIGRIYLSRFFLKQLENTLIANTDLFIKEPLLRRIEALSMEYQKDQIPDDSNTLFSKKNLIIVAEIASKSLFEYAYNKGKEALIVEIKKQLQKPLVNLSSHLSREVGGVILRQIAKVGFSCLAGATLTSFFSLNSMTKHTEYEEIGAQVQAALEILTSIKTQLAGLGVLSLYYVSKGSYHFSQITAEELRQEFSSFISDKIQAALRQTFKGYIQSPHIQGIFERALKDREFTSSLSTSLIETVWTKL